MCLGLGSSGGLNQNRSSREASTDVNKRIAWLLGIAVSSITCFTTVGYLWIPPGLIFIVVIGILILEMIREFEEAGEKVIASVPHWKRTAALAGVFVIIIPLVFGTFTENTELSSYKDEDGSYFVQPMDSVRKEGNDGNVTNLLIRKSGVAVWSGLFFPFAVDMLISVGLRLMTSEDKTMRAKKSDPTTRKVLLQPWVRIQ